MNDDITIFAHLMQTALPLAKRLASDDYSAEDRKKLRELAGKHTIFELNNELAKLCGERARKMVINNLAPEIRNDIIRKRFK